MGILKLAQSLEPYWAEEGAVGFAVGLVVGAGGALGGGGLRTRRSQSLVNNA